MTHLEERLLERNIHIRQAELERIASQYRTASAIILAKGTHQGDDEHTYYNRKESNGDMVVMIVRNRQPKTIMFRRSSQTNKPEQLRVNQIIDLSRSI